MSGSEEAKHPRTIGWVGTAALAMGGSNQSLLLIAGATGLVAVHGSAAIPLLALGLLLAWMAAPGWTELVLMRPDRVGGIAASCTEAFRPYSPILANLTGTCYWWGRVPACGLSALLAASAIHQWYWPHAPTSALAVSLVLALTGVNLLGVRWVARLAVPVATVSAALAFLSGLLPVLHGLVNWRQAASFHLVSPFSGVFGGVTGAMAGLSLVGFAAPAFEAAACYVGETVDPDCNVPRAMRISALLALVYGVFLPTVWLGVLGTRGLTETLMQSLGPTFGPLLGGASRAAVVWFLTFSAFQGALQPLAGASRTLAQMAEDGLLPRVLARRTRTGAPWAALLLTAGASILFLLIGAPAWMIAAAGLAYLIGIALPSIAVWLLRRDAPHQHRPYRAPDWAIGLGVAAALAWGTATLLGFAQFGLRAVLFGVALAGSGAMFYFLRRRQDRVGGDRSGVRVSLYAKLTGAMLLALALAGGASFLAISGLHDAGRAWVAALQDLFVAIVLLTIPLGLVLPGAVAHAVEEVAGAARRLADGTASDFARAVSALAEGQADNGLAHAEALPVVIHSRDELGAMADSFNAMQDAILRAARGLNGVRDSLRSAGAVQGAHIAELRESRERLQMAAYESRDGLWNWGIEDGTAYFSPRWKAILGCADHELPNRISEYEERIYVDDRERFQAHLRDYLRGDLADYEIEFRMYHQDGGVRWIRARGSALRNAQGRASRMAGSHTDITERKRAEEEQARLANYNRLLLESSGEGLFGIDLDGNCTFINQAGARMLGLAPEAILGRSLHTFTHHSHDDSALFPVDDCPISRAFTQGVACRVDTEMFRRADGTAFAVEYAASPICEEGVLRGAVVTFSDITERRRTEHELLRAKQVAEAASIAKSQFLANMSHELRTPMNAILGFSEMLQEPTFGELNARQGRYVGNILTSGKHLLQLINDILDLSKVEAGHMALEYQILDASEVLQGAHNIAKALASKKRVGLAFQIEPSLPPLAADAARVKQVLYNLLSNAIKFTPEDGHVRVEACNRGDVLEVAVVDTGIGLEEDKFAKIFQEFEQVDSSYARKQQGTGLGLSLTRQLVEMHGGRVWAESAGLGLGSTFRFTLPWRPAGGVGVNISVTDAALKRAA